MNKWLVLSFVALSFSAPPLYAAPRDELSQTQSELRQARSRQTDLSDQNRKLEGELGDLQEQLVKLAAAIQKSERALSKAEATLAVLDDELGQKRAALEKNQARLQQLLQAVIRLSRMPPEAMVMMPGDSEAAIKAARALKMTSASIKEEVESISFQVAELEQLQEQVRIQRDELSAKQQALDKERNSLKTKLIQRQALLAALGKEERQEAEKIARLAKKASSLQDLLGRIAAAPKPAPAPAGLEIGEQKPASVQAKRGQLRSFAEARGHIRAPLAGRVVRGFGANSGKNETSKGLSIVARPGAQVTAPYDGEVVFASNFLNYGKMLIIRHSDDFHTLLTGMARIDVRPGDFLLEGEPIGAMGDRDSSARLYVELRKRNQPIDPAPWLGLK